MVSSGMADTRGAGVPMAWPAGGASVWGAAAPAAAQNQHTSKKPVGLFTSRVTVEQPRARPQPSTTTKQVGRE